jgi:molybdenum cofactor biosynthesis protein B
MPDPAAEHAARAEAHLGGQPIAVAVMTVSDTRTEADDRSGARIIELLEAAGHRCHERVVVPDEPAAITGSLRRWLEEPAVAVVLCSGGTGLAPRDRTVEVLRPLLTTELEGFGELFRMLSFQEIGAAAMSSRSIGGLVARDASAGGDTFVFAMPGSPAAVELAMTRLILPQLPHLVWLRRNED